ncbi:MAG: IS66 family transposase [Mycobacteriales bacterium]
MQENTALREHDAVLAAKLVVLMDRVAELELRAGQTPRNSHKPPSSEGYEKPAPRSRRERTDRRSGGQPGHEGRTLRQVQTPDEVVVHQPTACGSCGSSLADAAVVSTEARQVFELPEIALRIIEHALQHRRCGCGAVTMAAAPAGVGTPTQYGPRVRAFATYLLAAQHLPLARTAELLTELLGAPISQGSLAGWYVDAAAGLDGVDEVLRDGLVGADVLGADETGIRVDGALAWVHAARTDTLTRYTVSPRRGVPAMLEAGVLDALSPDTVLVSDFWAPYWTFNLTHAVCGAHLGRELVSAAEVNGQSDWAQGLDRLLLEINRAATQARQTGDDALAADLLETYRRRYQQFITAGWAANPDHLPGGRGKSKRPKHVNLLDRLDAHREEVLRYADDLRVPFTNNGSEQDIRPLKVRMKVAGCLRTMTGAQAFCRLRSYLSTARKQGQSTFAALRMLHDGNPWMPAIAGYD